MEGGDFLPAVGTVELTTRGTTLPPLDAILAKLVTTLKGHGLKEGKPRSGEACLFILQIKRGATWDDIRCEFWHRQD